MTTFSDSVIEAVSAVDIPSVISSITYTHVGDSAAATDNSSAKAILGVDTIALLSAEDIIDAVAVFHDSVTESISAIDAPDALALFNVIESISAIDTINELVNFNAKVVESIFAVDATHASPIDVSVIESITITENLKALKGTISLPAPGPPHLDPNWIQNFRNSRMRILNSTYTQRAHGRKWVYPK